MRWFMSLCAGLLISLPAVAQDKKPDWSKHPRGYKAMPEAQKAAIHAEAFRRHGHAMKYLAKRITPPAVFDTVTMGWSPPVVDQGQCGDCFGVSSSDACTAAFIKGGWGKADGTFKISDQYGLDCGAYQGGCNGGDEAQVIDWMKSKGFPAEKWVDPATGKQMSDYGPYTANPGRCGLSSDARMWKLQDYGFVAGDQGQGPATLDEFKAALMTYGQLSIALDASSFNNYSGGVIPNLGNSIDHAISCIGWDDSKQALHCRNNWGTSWGESGNCWISYKAVPQIAEPMWLLAPTLVPPQPPPTPPVPPPGPVPPGPVPPGPTPVPGTVTITLTPDQVTAVITQSGTVTIDDLFTWIKGNVQRGKEQQAAPKCCEPILPPAPTRGDDDPLSPLNVAKRLEKLEKDSEARSRDVAEIKEAVNRMLDVIMPKKPKEVEKK